MLGAASSTAAEGGVAMTERHYMEAADLFGRAAGLVPSGQPDETEDYLSRQADALYRDGDERGHNDALRTSIDVWRRVLEVAPRDRGPLDWAATQNNLGNALETLGERESGTASLEAAVAAFDRALPAFASAPYYAERCRADRERAVALLKQRKQVSR
jgi:tetratricopeptide (TPR) repeat protein